MHAYFMHTLQCYVDCVCAQRLCVKSKRLEEYTWVHMVGPKRISFLMVWLWC